MPYDAAWFSRYDTIVAEAGDLDSVAEAHKEAKQKLELVQAETDAAVKAREKQDAFMKEQEWRIDLVSKHWFFGTTALQPQLWMRGGVEGKKARAQAKLEMAKADHPALLKTEASYVEEKLPQQKEEVKQLAATIELKKSLAKERDAMREQAIAANPSNEMTRLKDQVETLQTTIAETTSGAEGIKSVAALCGEANELYTKAAKLGGEATAAGKEAEAIIGPIAEKEKPNTRPPSEPAEHAEEKERHRQSAVLVLNGQVETLKTTIEETSAGGDGLKAAHLACAKASTCFATALKATLEARAQWEEGEATMHPADKEPLYGAAPPIEKKPCPSGSGNAITRHPTHCSAECAKKDDGIFRPLEQHADCDNIEACDVAAWRASTLEHLRVQATTLKATMKDTSEGADGLKAAAELCIKARAKYERAIQCTKWADKAQSEADKVINPTKNKPWAGCEFASGSASVERAAALKELKAAASLLMETIDDKTWAANELTKANATCKKAHESYMKAMQSRRAADRLAPSVLDDEAQTSASVSARDAKMREVQKEGDEGAKHLQKALDSLPGGTHGSERFTTQYDAAGDVSALASDMDSLATVQGCVTLVADKLKILDEVENTLRKEIKSAKDELAPMTEAFKQEGERETHMNEASKERAEGDKLVQQAVASVTPPTKTRYEQGSSPIANLQIPTELRESMNLAQSTSEVAKELEALLRKDYDIARNHLAPIELAIKALDKAESLVQKAMAEADKGAGFLNDAFKAVPTKLPERYPATDEMIGCDVIETSKTVEAKRVRVIREMAALASLKERKGKEHEVTVRRDCEAAKAELKTIEAALKAEQKRNDKMADAQEEADRGAHRLHQASATVPAPVPVRYPQQSASLVGLNIPHLGQTNTQEKIVEFVGTSAAAAGPTAEWESADKVRQTVALTKYCESLSAQLQKNAKELETTLRTDCDKAKVELQETKDAMPAEEDRIFEALRKAA